MAGKIKVEWGSGNVFADLGFENAEEMQLKSSIVAELYRLKSERKLTQTAAGKLLGISQPEVSRLFRGHLDEYSVERLLKFLMAFGQDVEIVVRPRRNKRKEAAIRFTAMAA